MDNTFTLNKIEFKGNLADPKVFDDVSSFAKVINSIGSKGTTYSFLQELEHLVKKYNDQLGGLKQKYEDLLVQIRFACFQLLPDEELGDILKSKMSEAYKDEVNLIRSTSLMFVPYFVQDDYTKLSRMLRYLEENQELIGTSNITTPEGKVVGPLVANWLKDYKSRTPEDKGSLNLISYLTQSDNCKKLNQDQSEFLKYILNFYDWLRFKASKTSFLTEESGVGSKAEQKSSQKIIAPVLKPQPKVSQTVSGFDKKLYQVSAPVPQGQDLEVLRQQMEKQGGGRRGYGTTTVKMTPDEIKREVATKELVAPHQEARQQVPVVPKPMAVESKPPVSKSSLQTLSQISMVDDLKKIDLAHLRQGPVASQTQVIKSKIISLANANKLLPYYTVNAFEQSPLFKAYLQVGSAIIDDNNPDRAAAFKTAAGKVNSNLTLQEFGAVADLKKGIERL